jgi:hypothetical protein
VSKTIGALLLLLLLLPIVNAAGQKPAGESFDASPCLDLLSRMIRSIPEGDEASFNQSMWWFTQASVPSSLEYLHTRVAGLLSKLARKAWLAENYSMRAEALLSAHNCSGAEAYVKLAVRSLIEAYSARDKLVDEGVLGEYVSSASKYINDTGLRFLLSRSLSLNVEELESYLGGLRERLSSLSARVSKCRVPESIALTIEANATLISALCRYIAHVYRNQFPTNIGRVIPP